MAAATRLNGYVRRS